MNVFDHIPNDFFNLLASGSDFKSNASCFLAIYDLFEKDVNYRKLRDEVRDVAAFCLMQYDIGGQECSNMPAGDRANDLIRKFCDVGWLRGELDERTYDRYIVMTEQGRLLAGFLLQLGSPVRSEYSTYIYDIYNTVRHGDQWRCSNPYAMGLKSVRDKTKALSESLKNLSSEIKTIVEDVTRIKTLAELQSCLLSYFDGSFIKEYYRLIKSNVGVYKSDILRLLNDIWNDKDIYDKIIAGYIDENEDKNEFDARTDIDEIFSGIMQFLNDDYGRLIHGIQNQICVYMNLAFNRLSFLTGHVGDKNADVNQVLKYLVKVFNAEEDLDCSDLFAVDSCDFIDITSFKSVKRQQSAKMQTPVVKLELTAEELRAAAEQQNSSVNDPFTSDRVRERTLAIMNGRNKLSAKEFPMQTRDDFLYTMATLAYAFENDFDVVKGNGYIEQNGFIVRNFELRNKGMSTND